ncbi:MAG: GNAT family N-acetyltransferase [Methylocella sp.]
MVNSPPPQEIAFRPVEERDFPLLSAWLAQPHVRKFYQKTSVTLEDVASEYGPCVRGEEPGICHLAISAGKPFAYLQCYRNAEYPEWAELIGEHGGISVDLFIGDTTYLRKGFGRAALSGYLQRVAFPNYNREPRAYIAHEQVNTAALRCSQATGFRPIRAFLEDGVEMLLLTADRSSAERLAPGSGKPVDVSSRGGVAPAW